MHNANLSYIIFIANACYNIYSVYRHFLSNKCERSEAKGDNAAMGGEGGWVSEVCVL